jgi:F0F1-type ATP synthase membrane subunit b/b'
MVFLQRLLAIVLGIALFVAAFIFASILLAVAAAFAIVLGIWLWWKTRKLRKAMRERDGRIIEGEYRVERERRRIEREP